VLSSNERVTGRGAGPPAVLDPILEGAQAMRSWTVPGAAESRATCRKVRLTPWALEPFLVGVLSAAAAIRKLAHTILTIVS